MAQPLGKIIWQFLKKLSVELSYNPDFPLLDVYSLELKTGTKIYSFMPAFIAALLTVAKR